MRRIAKLDAEDVLGRYLPWIKTVSRRLSGALPGNYEEEFISAGICALLQAVERFDPRLNTNPDAFFLPRIYGEIVDEAKRHFRDFELGKHSHRDYHRAFSDLSHTLGRKPTDAELASHMNVSEEIIFSVRQLESLLSPASLGMVDDEYLPSGFIADKTSLSPEEALERNDLREKVEGFIAGLSRNERLVVVLHYYEGLSFKEVAEVMGVSKGWVSQVHSAVTRKLYALLSPLVKQEGVAGKAPPGSSVDRRASRSAQQIG